MKIKIKYLNWDKEVKTVGPGNLLMCYLTGDTVAINDANYRDINEYTVEDAPVNFELQEKIFEEHNRIDDETFCRLKEDQRSMCVGDLIFIDDDCYVVKNIGFEKINI